MSNALTPALSAHARSVAVGAYRPQDRLTPRAPLARRLRAQMSAAKPGSALARMYRVLLENLTTGEDRAAAWRAARGSVPLASVSRGAADLGLSAVAEIDVVAASPVLRRADDVPEPIAEQPALLVRAPRAPGFAAQRTA